MRIEILRQIDDLTENHCKPCTLVKHSHVDNDYQQLMRKHCYGSCTVGAKLRELGDQLAEERQRRKKPRQIAEQAEDEVAAAVEPPKRKRAKRPGQKKRLNPITKAELARMLESGMTLAEIERAKGLQMNTLSRWAKKWGLNTKPKEDGEVKITKEKYLSELAAGKSRAQIAREHGMSNGNLYYWLDKWGVRNEKPKKPKKTIAEAAAEAAKSNSVKPELSTAHEAATEPAASGIDWFSLGTEPTTTTATVSITAKSFAFDAWTAKHINVKPGDRVAIGYADGKLYFRRDESGIKLQKNGKAGARASSKQLQRWPHWQRIAKKRYPVTVQDGLIVAEVGGDA